jgi:hypothetical protein
MPRSILFQDPYHPYATRFIEHFHRKYGYRAICFYTDRRQRLEQESRFPLLRSERVEAVYDVSLSELGAFGARVRARHDVAAVVPFQETAVVTAAQLGKRLGLDWAQPEVMRRFRDKLALKEHLRREHPELRINASKWVHRLSDVLSSDETAYQRFVLKPNDGFGNRGLALFDRTAPAGEITAYLRRMRGVQVLMEEYIGGTEYFVNGQVDARGEVTVVAIFEYVRVPANGRHNLDFETLRVARTHPAFEQLGQYATRVMQATGLLRSPFHLELKVDEQGPCLIEVGARLPGLGNAFLCNELHGEKLDLFDLAAHYYLEPSDYGTVPLDWQAYDAGAVRYVHGIATRRERIYELEGVEEIQALPAFHHWVKVPAIGDFIEPTVDSLNMPFSLVLKAATEPEAAASAAEVRRLLRWNRSNRAGLQALGRAQNRWRRHQAALRHRVLSFRALDDGNAPEMDRTPDLGSLVAHALSEAARARDALTRRLQLSGLGRRTAQTDSQVLSPERLAEANDVLKWAREYLARPHPDLGRKGPICPFVQHAIDIDRFLMTFHDEVDGSSARQLRRVVLDEAAGFQRRYPQEGRDGGFTSLLLVFPKLPEQRLGLLDRVHDELKSHLMSHDLMSSPFHELCTKKAITGSGFEAYRAPFAAFVIRHMDVRDIAFLGTNRPAFRRYREKYGTLYAQGKVSDEFGYVQLYEQACERFGTSK